MPPDVMSFIGDLSLVLGVFAIATGGYFAFTKNYRDGHAQALGEAQTTIEMLEKQNELLTEQLNAMHEEKLLTAETWRRREEEWTGERKKLEERVNRMESDYRSLVLTVTTMGFCAEAANCNDYNPGDRRVMKQRPAK